MYTVAPRSRSMSATMVTATGCVVAGYGLGELHITFRSTRSPRFNHAKSVAADAASRMARPSVPNAASRGTPASATRTGGRTASGRTAASAVRRSARGPAAALAATAPPARRNSRRVKP
jgi:hypothetical protein